MRALLGAFLLVALPAHGGQAAGGEFDSAAQRGIARVYNLDFEQAETEFRTMVAVRPADPAGYFFLAMVRWWMIMIDIDNEQEDGEFTRALDAVVTMCDSLLEKNPDDVNAIFFKGGALGFEGRLRFHRNDYFGAADAARRALPLVRSAMALDPGNDDILLGAGIYSYYADVIPSEYPVVKPLMLFVPPGDRQKGIRDLTVAAAKGRYASVEAKYFLLQIYYAYEKDYVRALALAEELHARFPANVVFHRYLGRIFVATNSWEQARTVFEGVIARVQEGRRGYTSVVEREARYYAGMAFMLAGRLDEALREFYRCDELSRTLDAGEASGYMSMANLRIGEVYDLQGKRPLALEQYRKVKAMANYQESHATAERCMAAPYTR